MYYLLYFMHYFLSNRTMLSKTTMTYLITTFRHVNLSQEIDRCTVYIYASNRDSTSSPYWEFQNAFHKMVYYYLPRLFWIYYKILTPILHTFWDNEMTQPWHTNIHGERFLAKLTQNAFFLSFCKINSTGGLESSLLLCRIVRAKRFFFRGRICSLFSF